MARPIKCNFNATDCVNNIHGTCKALQEQFSGYCPFYKTKAQYNKELRMVQERLKRIIGRKYS